RRRALEVYGVFRDKGYVYGPSFCGISELYVGRDEALARIETPRILRRAAGGYLFHPAVLGAGFPSAILHPSDHRPGELLPFSFLPTGIERIQVSGEVTLPLWAHSRARRHDLGGLRVDIVLTDDHGTVLAEYSSLRGKVVWQSTTGEQGEQDRIDS